MERLRKSLLLVLSGILAVILFGSVPAGAIPVVRIHPSLSTPSVGNAFDVAVDISSVTDLYAYQFEIRFNPAVLSALSVSEGSFLMGGGATFFIPGEIDNPAGVIHPTGNMLLGALGGVNGAGTLALVQFQVLAAGWSPIDLSNVNLLDSSLGDISSGVEGDTVNAVPEPLTFFLFGFSLFFLLGCRLILKREVHSKPLPLHSESGGFP
jgi:general secretion pathway protein D